ncbi:MAG TPA: hypothetical protein VE988_15475 [Gemmataceae bacterium]|nr:hypothetical protein [Gemmataceae bacterium]
MKRGRIIPAVLTALTAIVSSVAYFYWVNGADISARAEVAACEKLLPDGLRLSSVLNAEFGFHETVKEILHKHGAHSRDGVIHDRNEKQIIFVKVQCEGPRPEPENDPMHWFKVQGRRLAKLGEQYTVITYCSYRR